MFLRFLTAGESHGQALVAIVEGFPAQVRVEEELLNQALSRRRRGYGRGGRMRIEEDRVRIISGIRHGLTMGTPIALELVNKDWENWSKIMAPFGESADEEAPIKADQRVSSVRAVVTAPRPGHADLSGALKYGYSDLRNIIERASARETAARVGVGALASILLAEFGIRIGSHVLRIGEVRAEESSCLSVEQQRQVEASPVRCLDQEAGRMMVSQIDQAKAEGESLGGVFLIYATGVPPGLGSHAHWDRRLDGRLAQAVMSIPGVKGVEFGLGFVASSLHGSKAHDSIFFHQEKGFYRRSNNAGGVEGGISNGAPLVLKAAMKPIPTLYRPLPTVDLKTKEPVQAAVERSDVTAVPAAGVVGEAVTAWVLAELLLEKFGGDSLPEMKRAWSAYTEGIQWRPEET